jgi:hypothetical protein
MPIYAYNLEKVIDKFCELKEVTAKNETGLIQDYQYYEYYPDVLIHSSI